MLIKDHSTLKPFLMKFILKLTGVLALAAVIASCSKEEDTSPSEGYSKAGLKQQPESIVIKASGEVLTAVNEFRTMLGNLNTAPLYQVGRRLRDDAK